MKLLSTAAVLAVAVAATPAAAQTWTGAHVGAYAGINAQNSQTQDYWCEVACDAPTLKGVDLAAGVTLGYDYQVDDNFVVGLEGDVGMGADDTDTVTYDDPDYAWDYSFSTKIKRLATLRARAGLAMGNTMVYATGGVAAAKVRFSADAQGTGTYSSSYTNYGAFGSQSMTGYTLGGGIEHSFGQFSVKAEMLHTDLGKSDQACFMDTEGTDAGVCWDNSSDEVLVANPVLNSVRIGFNYKF